MTRAGTFAIPTAHLVVCGLFASLFMVAIPVQAHAKSAPPRGVAVDRGGAEEFSAQSRDVRRTPRRIRIYRGSNYPGPNSKRVCNAHLEQEYRPSGTVIVPRMNCYWSG
jgi:hypothetical protein